MVKDNTDGIQSLEKAFDIVEILRDHGTVTPTEIADRGEYPVSTIHSYLTTLERRGYVLNEDDGYRLSGRFVHLGDSVKYQRDIYRAGEPILRELSEQTGESINLLVEEFGMGIYLESMTADTGFQNYSYVRRREYLHSTAAGKAILSELPGERIEAIVDEHGLAAQTENTITDVRALDAELETVKQRGVALNDEENTPGLRAVGAPIRVGEAEIAAVSISAPISRLKGERFEEEYPTLVKEGAKSIEVDLV